MIGWSGFVHTALSTRAMSWQTVASWASRIASPASAQASWANALASRAGDGGGCTSAERPTAALLSIVIVHQDVLSPGWSHRDIGAVFDEFLVRYDNRAATRVPFRSRRLSVRTNGRSRICPNR